MRREWIVVVALLPLGLRAQSVIELPGVRASATPGCVEPAHAGSAALSYACLNMLIAPEATASALAMPGADLRTQPTNHLGLYNASGLKNRMGPNLGTSVNPYRPTPSYPAPLATPKH